MRIFTTAFLTIVAGCSNPQATPDAGITSDATSHDGHPAADAAVDVAVDGGVSCPANELCFLLSPVDGVTNLPAGRLAIAWVAEGSDPSSAPQIEVAYDQPWVAASITKIEISDIAAPSAGMQTAGAVPNCTSAFAPSIAVLSTDPDASGSISSDEILNGTTNHSTYGIHQQIVAWFSDPCAADPPDFPEGFAKGIHVYTNDTPVHLLDGTATALQTCLPGTAACSSLNDPF